MILLPSLSTLYAGPPCVINMNIFHVGNLIKFRGSLAFTAKILHTFSKRYKVNVFNVSLGVLGTQDKKVSLILFGFNETERCKGEPNQKRK